MAIDPKKIKAMADRHGNPLSKAYGRDGKPMMVTVPGRQMFSNADKRSIDKTMNVGAANADMRKAAAQRVESILDAEHNSIHAVEESLTRAAAVAGPYAGEVARVRQQVAAAAAALTALYRTVDKDRR